MNGRLWTLLAIICCLALPRAAMANAESGFEWIRSLEGRWEGITWWSHKPDDRTPVNLTYYLTGRGSAVIENFSAGTDPSMTSVYHMDGADLRMTHYCSAKNQPRLKATSIDEEERRVEFSFLDITNLSSPDAGHVTGAELHFRNKREMTLIFTFTTGGKVIREFIEVTRVDDT